MKGTTLDFLKLARENEELAREFIALAKKYDFEFIPPDELTEEELERLAGGLVIPTGSYSPGTGSTSGTNYTSPNRSSVSADPYLLLFSPLPPAPEEEEEGEEQVPISPLQIIP